MLIPVPDPPTSRRVNSNHKADNKAYHPLDFRAKILKKKEQEDQKKAIVKEIERLSQTLNSRLDNHDLIEYLKHEVKRLRQK